MIIYIFIAIIIVSILLVKFLSIHFNLNDFGKDNRAKELIKKNIFIKLTFICLFCFSILIYIYGLDTLPKSYMLFGIAITILFSIFILGDIINDYLKLKNRDMYLIFNKYLIILILVFFFFLSHVVDIFKS